MKRDFLREVEKYIEEHRRKMRWHKVVAVLACVTVFCTVCALVRSGIAMEKRHTHSEECYVKVAAEPRRQLVCDADRLKIHTHSEGCYDGGGNLICGYADFVVHKHDAACYDGNGNLWCTLPEIEVHEHTAECYAQDLTMTTVEVPSKPAMEAAPEPVVEVPVEPAAEGAAEPAVEAPAEPVVEAPAEPAVEAPAEPAAETPAEPAVETPAEPVVETPAEPAVETPAEPVVEVPTEPVLICTKQEIILHQHTNDCYDEQGRLICGRLQVLEHQHTEGCFVMVNDDEELTCTLPEDENHTHGPLCYGTWQLACGKEEGQVDDGGSLEDSESIEDTSSEMFYDISRADEEENALGLNITLLYGDRTGQEANPDGVSSYTHSTMSGYIRLEPSDLKDNLENVTVTLTIPKEYVEKESVNIPPFTSNSGDTEYTITEVTEDENNYCISINFSSYDKTQTLVLPFALSFQDDIVPDNYRLPVTASVVQDSSIISTTEPNIYKPLYKDWGIDKFVNSNRLEIFKDDGAHAVVTPTGDSDNPYLDDLTYVNFAFRVNNVINSGSNLNDFRDATEVTLTDQLPIYTDKDGKECRAIFDPDKNPGWTYNEENQTVSKTYTGESSVDVLMQIYDDEPLKLRFPGLKFEPDGGYLIANLANTVDLVAVPSNEAEGETRPTAEDELKFVMTTETGAVGSFSKTAQRGNIYDAEYYKTNPYPWRIRFSNDKGMQPLEHIAIQDREIRNEKTGEVVLKGVDPALKFVSINSDVLDSRFTTQRNYAEIVEKVVAYYEDGTTQDFPVTADMIDKSGNFNVVFDETKVCVGYDIIFRDDFQLNMKETVSFMAYTVYRDPVHTVVPEGVEKITYENSARSVNSYPKENGDWVFSYLTATHRYDMLPVTEELKVAKDTWDNSSTKNNMVGDKYVYAIFLTGSLMTPDQKQYGDIRIVDLLPNEVEFVRTTNGYNEYTNGSGEYTRDGTPPDIIENYHNSGRTALIYHITYEDLIKYWERNSLATLSFEVQIREDAHPGTVRNDVYVVGDNLEEYTGKTGGMLDIYDLNDNGRTDDRIAWDDSDATIVAGASIYAEKFIALADSENWSRQGLSLKAGMDFDYLLKVTNELERHTGLVVYDTLPAIGDRGVLSSGSGGRNSEFKVQLRSPIDAPEGYTAWYTTSQEVYQNGMSEMVSADIWTEASGVSDWSAVTAFKLVADEGTELTMEAPFQVRIPAHIPATLDEASMEKLEGKTYQDQSSGTVAYLQANNNFGFTSDQASNPKESNTVWTRIPFAGFAVQKVDYVSKTSLEGAEFTLTKEDDDAFHMTAVSGADGFLEFRNLLEGTYTLEETGVPAGYRDDDITLTVTITQNPVTMEYTVEFAGDGSLSLTGKGTNAEPLCIENMALYELPATGAAGTALYTAGGWTLIAGALFLMYVWIKRRRA